MLNIFQVIFVHYLVVHKQPFSHNENAHTSTEHTSKDIHIAFVFKQTGSMKQELENWLQPMDFIITMTFS